ncbi:hypothetical protein Y1Q_0023026 [Alligator mississippiensis]|uniref:Uncharacterized protein n=1 Tax=Alligator mississippiensis TaxID=8496 RepID=A0A151P7F3_ALLMI|nr:hypothetical protein Y1Q_0023026 [Alligator mississippiensis]
MSSRRWWHCGPRAQYIDRSSPRPLVCTARPGSRRFGSRKESNVSNYKYLQFLLVTNKSQHGDVLTVIWLRGYSKSPTMHKTTSQRKTCPILPQEKKSST